MWNVEYKNLVFFYDKVTFFVRYLIEYCSYFVDVINSLNDRVRAQFRVGCKSRIHVFD